MSIYITQQQKEEWEAKVAELEEKLNRIYGDFSKPNGGVYFTWKTQIKTYKEILLMATVLPIEESWEEFDAALLSYIRDEEYPNGIIIKKK
jgi:hypothetical protein